jgi:hypothetical protein
LTGCNKEELGPCKLTTRALMSTGYAQLKYKDKLVYEHRLAFAEANGLDVFDLGGLVLHKCDVRACINPEHLFLGTYQDNMDDKVAKGRQTKGLNTTFGKLTTEDREYIQQNYRKRAPGVRSNIYELAQQFGVHYSSIYHVIRGEFA